MFKKLKKIASLIFFLLDEYNNKKKYKNYFNNEFLIKNLKSINEKDLNIFPKFIYDKK